MAETDGIRGWIRHHEVCFETAPHYEVLGEERLHVGFDLTLLASLPKHPAPGGPDSVEVYNQLREIAVGVLPGGARYEIGPYDSSHHLRPQTEWQPEVQLVVQLRHSHGTFDIVDEGDSAQLKQICGALLSLGLKEKVWREMRGG